MRPRVVPIALAALAAGWWPARHLTAPTVRRWRLGAGERRRAGPLSVRTLGRGERAVVLLHGITASGDVFGASYDALGDGARLVVPDLLGFARSLDKRRKDHSLAAHLEALDAMAAALGLGDGPLVVAGHSLGALLALHWAARRPGAVERVVGFGAPLYRTPQEADARIRAMGPLEALFALEGPLSERMCALMCEHRTLAAWLIVALRPQWPVAIARRGVDHTWASYLGAMNGVIRNPTWEPALAALTGAGIPVTLAEGHRDRVPVPRRAAELAAAQHTVRAVVHPTADHELPVTEPGWCLELVRR